MDHAELRDRIDAEEDFIALPRHENSVEVALRAYPNGLPARTVARAMGRTEQEIAEMHEEILAVLRQHMGQQD